MTTEVPGDSDIQQLWDSFEHTAFRLEAQPSYAVPEEQESLAEFRSGGPMTPHTEIGYFEAWLDQVRGLVQDGRRVRRVRILDAPPSEYQRWELWSDHWYRDVGEEITYLDRELATSLGIPSEDWWLFDDTAVVLLRQDADRTLSRWEFETEPERVAPYVAWRELALRRASPTAPKLPADP